MQCAADLKCVAVSDPLTKEFESAEPADKAVVVATAAEEGDALCSQAVSMLMTAYGAEAGNVALKFMPVRTLADDLSRWAALLRT